MREQPRIAVAVVGLGAILPDAPNVQALWQNLESGRYSVTDVDPQRWDPALYYDPDPRAPDKTYSRIGGWVRDWEWDPMAWHLPVPPRVADAMDDVQKWAISGVRAALIDAGWPRRGLDPERTGVILGNALAGEKHYVTALRVAFPEFARDLVAAPTFAALPAGARESILREAHDVADRRYPVISE